MQKDIFVSPYKLNKSQSIPNKIFEDVITLNNASIITDIYDVKPSFDYLHFSNCDFKNEFKLEIETNLIKFENCTFEENCGLFNKITNIQFHNCTFHKNLNISLSVINNNLVIDKCIFEKESDIILDNTTVNAYLSITNSTISKNLLFVNTVINGLLILRNNTLQSGIDLSLGVFTKMNFFSSNFKNYKSSENNNQNEYLELARNKQLIPTINKLETFRIIRKYYEDIGDTENGFKYYKIELEIQKSQTEWYNKVILFFNNISNKHGESWVWGVGFTVIVGFLFYILILISSCFSTHENFWIGYLNYLNPLHDIKNIISETNWLVYTLDFIGRIFVGYGVYQTIQAFRKYKKK